MSDQNTKLEYINAWSDMMATIWQDKLRQLPVFRTGALYNSIAEGSVSGDANTVIVHRFLEYGIYVDAGTGSGYKRGNGGDLGFIPDREARPWFSKKYFASYMNLVEAMAEIYGEEFARRITASIQTD